jgi:hypothetical protein
METRASPTLMDLLNEYEEEHSFMRKLVLPQDDSRRLTEWHGGYRWFSSPNVTLCQKLVFSRHRCKTCRPLSCGACVIHRNSPPARERP